MKADYRQVFKNVTPVARTLSEANRDADYATPIWVCEGENVSAMRLMGFVVGMGAIFMMMGIAFVAFLTWIGIVVW